MKELRAAVAMVVLIGATSVNTSGARFQLAPRPYDLQAVRKAAAQIQREITRPSHREDALGGPLQFIVESLADLTDLKDVPDDVLDAVAAVAGSGRMETDTLARFGDRAVDALIRSARSASPRPPYPGGAMNVLHDMLLYRTAGPPLSEGAMVRVRAAVRDLLGATQLDFAELAALGRLAVATGDPALRAAAERLTDPSVLTARGVPTASQTYVISTIRRALDN
jgi:hypothetical protein